MPARNISLWLAITASAGTSLRVGINVPEYFMGLIYRNYGGKGRGNKITL
jgi:hypothetical protein